MHAADRYTAHPKILALPLGIWHPRRIKKYGEHLASVPRQQFVGDAIKTLTDGLRTQMQQAAVSQLPPNALIRIGEAPSRFKFGHLDEFPRSHEQYWYWRFTALSRFVLSPPGAGLDCYRNACFHVSVHTSMRLSDVCRCIHPCVRVFVCVYVCH